jgi:hypothetical protein
VRNNFRIRSKTPTQVSFLPTEVSVPKFAWITVADDDAVTLRSRPWRMQRRRGENGCERGELDMPEADQEEREYLAGEIGKGLGHVLVALARALSETAPELLPRLEHQMEQIFRQLEDEPDPPKVQMKVLQKAASVLQQHAKLRSIDPARRR